MTEYYSSLEERMILAKKFTIIRDYCCKIYSFKSEIGKNLNIEPITRYNPIVIFNVFYYQFNYQEMWNIEY